MFMEILYDAHKQFLMSEKFISFFFSILLFFYFSLNIRMINSVRHVTNVPLILSASSFDSQYWQYSISITLLWQECLEKFGL